MFVEFFGEIFKLILNFVQTFGYTGIFIMTFIESTFIPIPSEFTLIPAGILIAKGELHLSEKDTFEYELAPNPEAAVHIGWLR